LDPDRRRAAALGAGLALLCGAATAQFAEPPLRAARWLAPGADPLRTLGAAPSECLAPPSDAEARLAVEVGRAAFRAPLLLGGQAARAGLACESCHRAGRSNPQFHFVGVSGAPGTADVTSSLFSSHRGDGRDNPVPIPDLSGPKAKLKVDQAQSARALEPFIHGLIVEEFDGPEPPPAVLAGLAAYVRALSPAACPAEAARAVSAAGLLDDARRAVRAALALQARGDGAAAIVMVEAARSRLGLIDERYVAPALAPQRARLRAADQDLAQAAEALRGNRRGAAARLQRWLGGSARLQAVLARGEPLSLFAPDRLARAF